MLCRFKVVGKNMPILLIHYEKTAMYESISSKEIDVDHLNGKCLLLGLVRLVTINGHPT
jgi:hypothetical protein